MTTFSATALGAPGPNSQLPLFLGLRRARTNRGSAPRVRLVRPASTRRSRRPGSGSARGFGFTAGRSGVRGRHGSI